MRIFNGFRGGDFKEIRKLMGFRMFHGVQEGFQKVLVHGVAGTFLEISGGFRRILEVFFSGFRNF